MVWAWQRQTSIAETRSRNGTTGTVWRNGSVDWKWSERTPGYPNAPLVPLGFYRDVKTLSAGNLNYHQTCLGNWDGSGMKPATAIFSGDWIPLNVDDSRWDFPSEIDEALKRAANDANQKVADAKFDIPVFCKELPETVKLLADGAQRLLKAARLAKRGNVKGAAYALTGRRPHSSLKRGETFANTWLELQFGWKPIVSDMVSAAVAITEIGKRNPIQMVRGTAQINRVHNSARFSESLDGLLGRGDLFYHIRSELLFFGQVGYYFEIENPVTSTLNQLGLTNPLSTAYTVFPFSFCVDWLANVGECIDGLSTWKGKRFVGGYATQGIRGTQEIRVEGWDEPPFSVRFLLSYDSAPKRVISFTKRDRLTYPIPTRLVYNIPDSAWHFTTAMSLLRKLF